MLLRTMAVEYRLQDRLKSLGFHVGLHVTDPINFIGNNLQGLPMHCFVFNSQRRMSTEDKNQDTNLLATEITNCSVTENRNGRLT